MTDKQIQALIDRYLAGETSPKEELVLTSALRDKEKEGTLPEELQAVLLMLGDLAEGEAAYNAIMASRQQSAQPPVARRRWLWPAAVAAAACIAIVVMLAWPPTEQQPPKGQLAQQRPASQAESIAQPLPSLQGEGSVTSTLVKEIPTPPPTPPLQGRGAAAPQSPQDKGTGVSQHPQGRGATAPRSSTRKALARRELPDTLGQGIWQDEENVLAALQMLAECEESIAQSEQRLRNDMVEATFTALPRNPQARLVVYDNGDYMVVDDIQPTIIEL